MKKELKDRFLLENSDSENHACTVTKNEENKTFSDFVDQVVSEIPVSLETRRVPKIDSTANDPISALHSRGLLNIVNKTSNCPGSEIDLTFYTEESHLGELMKLFSSSHKFRNGKLVYATTQEVTPQLAKEVDDFNRRWQLECSPALMTEQKNASKLAVKQISTKKSLMEMLEDLKKEQIIKRYQTANRRREQPKKNVFFPKDEVNWQNQKTAFANDLRHQRVKTRMEESQNKKFECSQKRDTIQINKKPYSSQENDYKYRQEPKGKKVYHAAWRHKPPAESPSKIVRFTIQQALKSPLGDSSKYSKHEQLLKASQNQTQSPSYGNKIRKYSANYSPIKERHHTKCENEWIERLQGVKCRHPYTIHDGVEGKPLIAESQKKHFDYEIMPIQNETTLPMKHCKKHCPAKGDSSSVSSSSDISIRTVFHDCADDFSNSTSLHASTRVVPKHFQDVDRKTSGTKGKMAKIHSLSSSPRKHDHTMRIDNDFEKCHHRKTLGNTLQKILKVEHPIKTNIESYAHCHTSKKERVAGPRGFPKTADPNVIELTEDDLQAMHILRNMVNREALEEFQKNYGGCFCKPNKAKVVSSFTREHFIRQINECRRTCLVHN